MGQKVLMTSVSPTRQAMCEATLELHEVRRGTDLQRNEPRRATFGQRHQRSWRKRDGADTRRRSTDGLEHGVHLPRIGVADKVEREVDLLFPCSPECRERKRIEQ